MLYLVSFIVTSITLIWLINKGGTQRVSILMLGTATTIGNAGFVALSKSRNIEEAILANKITYIIGIFVPMILFIVMCEICQIKIKNLVMTLMSAFQMLLYLCVCSIGFSDIFYRSVEFHMGDYGAYLVKTYGPIHTVYVISMIVYFVLCILVAIYSLSKKKIVNSFNIELILAVDMVIVLVYLIERFLRLEVELLPVVCALGLIFNIMPMVKMHTFTVERNTNLIHEKFSDSAFIMFDKKLRYRGCNDYARELFPELDTWEIERKIPGNGGRFNTYLRQPLLKYVRTEDKPDKVAETFDMKNEHFEMVARKLFSENNLHRGYIIEIRNITDYVEAENKMENGQL